MVTKLALLSLLGLTGCVQALRCKLEHRDAYVVQLHRRDLVMWFGAVFVWTPNTLTYCCSPARRTIDSWPICTLISTTTP